MPTSLAFNLETIQMIIVFALIAITLSLYVTEKLPLELTSFMAICALMLFFYYFPVIDSHGKSLITPKTLLVSFANPALFTVLALLVLGEGLARTGVLDHVAVIVHKLAKGRPNLSIFITLLIVMFVSGIMNNIPVVVLFIPVIQALTSRANIPASHYMMNLSFSAILGGMLTLIGSSTNLLVSAALIENGEKGFSFFTFTIPGLFVASIGMVYVLFIAPKLLPKRSTYASELHESSKQFKTQILVSEGSHFQGLTSTSGFFPQLKRITLLMVMRGHKTWTPPFDNFTLQDGDILTVAATRDTLTNLIVKDPLLQLGDITTQTSDDNEISSSSAQLSDQSLVEVMIQPTSSYVGRTLNKINFTLRHKCLVLGIERRASMLRQKVNDIILQEGDVLLLQGTKTHIKKLRGHPDVLPMDWSETELPKTELAIRACLIFLGVIIVAATGLLPISVATLTGVAVMLLTKTLSISKAIHALDRKVVFLIASALSLGLAMEATGGAHFLANILLDLFKGSPPLIILSAFFLLVSVLANILSTKATAVLFAPIAIEIAHSIHAPVEAFAVAVVFAANCSFASPVGYQTNLLVMAPGRYVFKDYIRVGLPLVIICWVAFSLFSAWWYDMTL